MAIVKDIMTIKELKALGYPEKMLREISCMRCAKSVIRRGGQGSTIYFIYADLHGDVMKWKELYNA